jgi:hypothetical protein
VKTLFKHQRVLFMILSLSVLILASSCGGGGGGGGDGDDGGGDGGGQPLSVYSFQLNLLADKPLTLSTTLDSQPITATLEKIFEGGTFNGTYALDNGTIIMSTGAVKVTTNIWAQPLSIGVTVPIRSIEGGNPDQGGIQITTGSDHITVTITSSGVNISLNGGSTEAFTWDEFSSLFSSDTSDTWEKQASFASSIINFIFNQLNFDINTITLIEENDTVLQKRSVLIDSTFTGTPPAGHAVKGTLTLSCPDGNAGPGGDFSEVFNNYWVNDPSDDIDQLYDGSVSFVGFLEDSDEIRDVITSIGFVPNSAEDPGGVFFDGEGLTIYETQETSGIFSIDDAATITITGGYSIMFYEPTP